MTFLQAVFILVADTTLITEEPARVNPGGGTEFPHHGRENSQHRFAKGPVRHQDLFVAWTAS